MIHDERLEMNSASLMKPLLISHSRESLPLFSCSQPQVPTFNLNTLCLESLLFRSPENLCEIRQRNTGKHRPVYLIKLLGFKQTTPPNLPKLELHCSEYGNNISGIMGWDFGACVRLYYSSLYLFH